jgi:hypothetical protein
MKDAAVLKAGVETLIDKGYDWKQRALAAEATVERLREAKDIFFRNAEAWEARALAAEAELARRANKPTP